MLQWIHSVSHWEATISACVVHVRKTGTLKMRDRKKWHQTAGGINAYVQHVRTICMTRDAVLLSTERTSLSYWTCTEVTELLNCLNCNVLHHTYGRRQYKTHINMKLIAQSNYLNCTFLHHIFAYACMLIGKRRRSITHFSCVFVFLLVAIFHLYSLVAFSCPAFSTPAVWCHIFMSHIFSCPRKMTYHESIVE